VKWKPGKTYDGFSHYNYRSMEMSIAKHVEKINEYSKSAMQVANILDSITTTYRMMSNKFVASQPLRE
jgi:hypothetical protein